MQLAELKSILKGIKHVRCQGWSLCFRLSKQIQDDGTRREEERERGRKERQRENRETEKRDGGEKRETEIGE